MTDAPIQLDPFEGQPVLSVGIEIPGAAGGLRDSLDIDPVQMHKGDKCFVLLETTTDKIRFDPVKDTSGVKRVHILAVEMGMIVDAELVEAHLREQRDKIATAKAEAEAEAKGMETMAFPSDEELHEAHEAGNHGGLEIEGCVDCQNEKDRTAADEARAGGADGLADKLEQQAADREAAAATEDPPNRARAAAEKKAAKAAAAKKAPAKKAAAKKAPARGPK